MCLIEVRNIGRFNINLINKNKSSNSLIKLLLSQKFFFVNLKPLANELN